MAANVNQALILWWLFSVCDLVFTVCLQFISKKVVEEEEEAVKKKKAGITSW